MNTVSRVTHAETGSIVRRCVTLIIDIDNAVLSYHRSSVEQVSVIKRAYGADREHGVALVLVPRPEWLKVRSVLTIEPYLIAVIRDVSAAPAIEPPIPVWGIGR